GEARREQGHHVAPIELRGLGSVEADHADPSMAHEETAKVVHDDARRDDRRIEAAVALARGEHVPDRDPVSDEPLETLRVRQRGPGSENGAHDPPEAVLRLCVILPHFERFASWQTSEDESTRLAALDRREAYRQLSLARRLHHSSPR